MGSKQGPPSVPPALPVAGTFFWPLGAPPGGALQAVGLADGGMLLPVGAVPGAGAGPQADAPAASEPSATDTAAGKVKVRAPAAAGPSGGAGGIVRARALLQLPPAGARPAAALCADAQLSRGTA